MCKSHKPKVSQPETQHIDPSVTNVTGTDISDHNGDVETINKQRKQKGFANTQLATLMSQIFGGGGKDTLG